MSNPNSNNEQNKAKDEKPKDKGALPGWHEGTRRVDHGKKPVAE